MAERRTGIPKLAQTEAEAKRLFSHQKRWVANGRIDDVKSVLHNDLHAALVIDSQGPIR